MALPPAGRLWYTKRVPTLHGGGSFGWLTRGWAQQIPPHISGTLACLASLPRQGPATGGMPSLYSWKRSSHTPSLSILIRMAVSALSAKPSVRVPTCGPHCKQSATSVVTRHRMSNTVRHRFIVCYSDFHVSLEGFKVLVHFLTNPVRHQAGKHWLEGIFFRSAHVLARREPQCPTRASVPDEGLSARREQVRASPTRSPHGPPHGPPHDSPHTEADLRRIDGLQFPIQWKTSIWYAFAAYAEPTPDN